MIQFVIWFVKLYFSSKYRMKFETFIFFFLHVYIVVTGEFSFLKVYFLVFYISAEGLKLNLCRKPIKGVYEYIQLLLLFSLRQSEFPWQLVNSWNLELHLKPKTHEWRRNLEYSCRRLRHFWNILMFFCTFELKYFIRSGMLVFTDWDCVP